MSLHKVVSDKLGSLQPKREGTDGGWLPVTDTLLHPRTKIPQYVFFLRSLRRKFRRDINLRTQTLSEGSRGLAMV